MCYVPVPLAQNRRSRFTINGRLPLASPVPHSKCRGEASFASRISVNPNETKVCHGPAYSDGSRPPIPVEADHPDDPQLTPRFRSKPTTFTAFVGMATASG